jgi:hypothetical protein
MIVTYRHPDLDITNRVEIEEKDGLVTIRRYSVMYNTIRSNETLEQVESRYERLGWVKDPQS